MRTALARPEITLDNIPEAYVRFDSEFRCTFINEAGLLALDLPRTQVIGVALWDLYKGTAGTPVEQHFQCVMAQRTVFSFEHHDNSAHLDYSFTAMPDSSDGILV